MNEQEWLTCVDSRRLAYSGIKSSSRRWRLVVCACARRVWELMEDERSRRAIEASEHVADGLDSERALAQFVADAETAWNEISRKYEDGAERAAAAAAFLASCCSLHPNSVSNAMGAVAEVVPESAEAERRAQVRIIRDIFGNPFRLVVVEPSWLTTTVLALASQMYESRDYSPMPILADALQDAGCDNDDILNHCRQPGEHVRGCWVVDLVLGKS